MSNPDRIVHRYIARGAAVVTEYRDGTNGRKDRYPGSLPLGCGSASGPPRAQPAPQRA